MNEWKKKRLNYTALMVVGIAIVVIDTGLLTKDSSIHMLVRISGTLMAVICFVMAIMMFIKELSNKEKAIDE